MGRIQLNVRLDKHPELSEALKQKAEELGISLNQVAIMAFDQFLGLSASTSASTNASTETQETTSKSTSILAKRLATLEQRVLQLAEDGKQRDKDIVALAEGLRDLQARDSNPGSPFKDWKSAKGD